MSTVTLIQYEDASPEVQAVFDDIKRTRNIPDVNNFWKALANHPETLRRTWEALAEIMKPGALDPLTKETDLRRGVGRQQLRLLHPLAHRVGPRQGDDRGAIQRAAGRHRHGVADQRPGDRDEGADRSASSWWKLSSR